MFLKAEAWLLRVAVSSGALGAEVGGEGDISISGGCLLSGSTVACAGHLESLRRRESREKGRGGEGRQGRKEEGEAEGTEWRGGEGQGKRRGEEKAVTVVSFLQGKNLVI